MFVANSAKYSDIGHPFGYLKASSNLSVVNLFVMPYNYPVLLPLLGEWKCALSSAMCPVVSKEGWTECTRLVAHNNVRTVVNRLVQNRATDAGVALLPMQVPVW